MPVAYFNILTPHKGTPLYDRMKAENRIIDIDDMGRWPGLHCYIKPVYCSAKELEENVRRMYRELYPYPSMLGGLSLPTTQVDIASWGVNLLERTVSRVDSGVEDFDAY